MDIRIANLSVGKWSQEGGTSKNQPQYVKKDKNA